MCLGLQNDDSHIIYGLSGGTVKQGGGEFARLYSFYGALIFNSG